MRFIVGALLTALCAVRVPGQDQQQPRVRFGPGVCGPLDPAYVDLATETNGHVFPVAPDEISKLTPILLGEGRQLLLRASGGREHTYSLPIDSSVQRVWLSASFDGRGGTFTVLAPDGTVVKQGEGIEDAILNCGRIVTIDAPTVGAWKLRLAPTARFWLVAESKADLVVETAEFPDGGALPGAPTSLRVRLSSHVRSARVALLSLDGEPLEATDLGYAPEDDQFTGGINVPVEPFRLAVTGIDERGARYQRMYPDVRRPSSR